MRLKNCCKTILCILFFFGILYAEDANVTPSTLVTAEEAPNVYSDISKPLVVMMSKPMFIVKLPANPTTGYTWFIEHYDQHLLTLVKQYYQENEHSRGMVGVGGNTYFTFKLNSSIMGSYVSEISLRYGRAWEFPKNAKHVLINVVIIQDEKNYD
jgi:inhibitor of cysteine peptidase